MRPILDVELAPVRELTMEEVDIIAGASLEGLATGIGALAGVILVVLTSEVTVPVGVVAVVAAGAAGAVIGANLQSKKVPSCD